MSASRIRREYVNHCRTVSAKQRSTLRVAPVDEGDERFMNEALVLAQRGLDEDEMPIGAVVVLDDELVGASYWRYRQDGLLDHADLVALRAAEKNPRIQGDRGRTALYVTLEPCLMCFGAAMSFGVGRIVFALEAPFDGASSVTTKWQPRLGFPPPGYQIFSNPEVVGGVRRDASLGLMQTYVDRHPEVAWLEAMLPGFSYPEPAMP
jgi:tRNA(adenine34) deaminase